MQRAERQRAPQRNRRLLHLEVQVHLQQLRNDALQLVVYIYTDYIYHIIFKYIILYNMYVYIYFLFGTHVGQVQGGR